jgi:uncharacterized iron-regulated protein
VTKLPAAIALVVASAAASADERALRLPIGDPARRDREAPLVVDGITDTARGDAITPADLAARLDGVSLVFVGESHTDMEFHRVQLRVIRELHARGRQVLVGLEMYPATPAEQGWLDRWSSDATLTEEAFLAESHWYRSWGYHWNYYRDIFLFAREKGIRMFGVNVPRDVVQAVRAKGFEGLTAEQKALLPPRIDLADAEHQRLFRAFFGASDSLHGNMPEPIFQGIFRAQCTWDAAMGWNALKALEKHGGEKAIMVVLVGSGHVAYGLGAERQARLWSKGRTASIVPVSVREEEGEPLVESVQASYADFVWGLPPLADPLYPVVGLSTPEQKSGERYKVIGVADKSPAAAAGFQVGDELVSIDGVPYTDKETANRLMAGKRWGDRVVYKVVRGGRELELPVLLRRRPPKASQAEAAPQPAASAPEAAPHAAAATHAPVAAPGGTRVRHALDVAVDVSRGRLRVKDVLRVPAASVAGGEAQFLLHAALKLTDSDPQAKELPAAAAAARRFFDTGAAGQDLYSNGKLKRYSVALPPGGGSVRLAYEGPFHFGLGDKREEYTRGFRETQGMVSKEGLYLAGSGFWYPYLGRDLVEFELAASQPEGWHLIAPGNGESRGADGRARWDSHGPVDEITLVGGPLVVYREAAGAVEALAYLRQKDDALAAKYLEATAQYLEMYRGLVGPYPYAKFALVENFWETGYGMPSYTLLGPQVIRFPFILASSYPHEILHNWWGNSVFVDYASGNWSEGLTAYMADCLIQEQRGRGEEYRRDTLAKYRSYVKDGRDFPLAEFRSRESASTEAVGYGKTLMIFHMLRQRLGDDGFRQWAARFYREHRGRQASWADVRKGMESVAKQDLGRLFADHVERAGAAALRVSASRSLTAGGGYEVTGVLEQTQPGAPLALDVPVVVQTSGAPVRTSVRLEAARAEFRIASEGAPLAVHVDPGFDVFRLVDPRETPASIGQLFGEPKLLAVLPSAAPFAEQAAWRALVEGWRSDSHQPEIRTDAELRELPKDRAVWILGRRNAFAARLFASGADYSLEETKLTVDRESVPLADHAVVVVRRHPANVEKAVGFVFADRLAALPGLGRKLPHYGKYSYLAFAGDEPANDLKGQWAPVDSPLRVDLRPAAEAKTALAALPPAPRKALAELPPVFSQKALLEHVAWLAAPEREGRGIGTKGLEDVAEYIASQFKAMGLQPGGDSGSYFQWFESSRSPSGAPVRLRNVIGVLPGMNAALAGQSALLTAHYDHLGSGWPDVHKGDEGRLHPGADDNASGVAVLIELAKSLAAGERPQRTLVFVAFSGEEAGLLGSRRYVESPPFPLDKTIGVINLDTVGRLGTGKLSVLAAGSASEWQHIFRGASFVTGVDGRIIPDGLESSDQKSFIDRGVPAVQIFTDPHADYHRPGDSADKVDGPGLVKVATYVKEGIAYLGERPQPLTNTIASMKGARPSAAPATGSATAGSAQASSGSGQGRRVSFGTMPDFAFPGPGVRVTSVVPGSPAEKAGVAAEDVILQLDGQDVADLSGYSAILRTLSPGQTVAVVLQREGAEKRLSVTVVER